MANETCDVCNQCCATVHYKNVNALKVGGTKHRASPPLQKVGGTCPPVHPWIYAHAPQTPWPFEEEEVYWGLFLRGGRGERGDGKERGTKTKGERKGRESTSARPSCLELCQNICDKLLQSTFESAHSRRFYSSRYRVESIRDISYLFNGLVSELSMNGIVCQRRYCTVVRYKHLKSDFTGFLKNLGYD